MKIEINEGDIVENDEGGRPIRIEKPETLIRIVYRADGSFWSASFHKKNIA